MFTDLSKEETIETFRRIKEESVKFTEENNCTLGLVFSTIGFGLDVEDRKDLLLLRDAPLSDTTMAHFYAITTAGKFINYSQLVADITSHPSIAAVLIHEFDMDMKIKANEIEAVKRDIHEGRVRESRSSHLHADAKGKQAFMEEGLNHVDGQTSLCYWP